MADFQIGETPPARAAHAWLQAPRRCIHQSQWGLIMSESKGLQRAASFLKGAGIFWFSIALIGQAAFVAFIALFYWTRTLTGRYAAWNDKPLISGYVAGDLIGNIMFGVHVLLAAVITLGGLMQLIPALRQRFPALHQWNGRLFMVIAFVMAFGGLWMGWVRGTQLSLVSNVAISLNGVLIIIFAAIAWWYAARRKIEIHRHWAMRTFMVVNGVWFLRVAMTAWFLLVGRVGMSGKLSGPADIFLVFGCYLIPLLGLELYFSAQRSRSAAYKVLIALLVIVMTIIMGVGIAGHIPVWMKHGLKGSL